MNLCDVVVIGAGPAGACAAAMLVDQGLSVIVLEKEQFPRFSIGESLLPQSMAFLDKAGLVEAVNQHGFQLKNGAAFLKDGQYTVFDFSDKYSEGPGTTFQVKRAEFDKLLADGAANKGAQIRYRHQLLDVCGQAGAMTLTVDDLNEQQQYQLSCRFVLDASGFGRVLPRLLDLESPSDFPVRKAVFTHVRDHAPAHFDRNKILITVHSQKQDIWFWLIPFSDGTSSLGVVGLEQHYQQAGDLDDEAMLWHFIKQTPELHQLLIDAEVVQPLRTIMGYSANVRQLFGDGYALLGNAGEFLDPVFSSGVTIALQSANLAVPLVVKQLAGQPVDWQTEFSDPLRSGIGCFKEFVGGWYDTRLQDIIFYPAPDPGIKRMVCSVLAGYAWDGKNPFVSDAKRRLNTLAQICAA
ncbi:NAD(P)/FAD-dependent oxidoreductase [Bowmanella pacifica]|uniref:FAD-dependent oxidoreductase n=2 Tax=Bowmanella TaxID=366580 RepID=A0A917YW27_9ALTE|nr:NAD(P)/FAD-dependent oxidoreductase [Bowmanella pacifica]GGO65905.1 FAD-dependent oxidoreductase [Bowmanella pacifica]